jgi:hypothetical protein
MTFKDETNMELADGKLVLIRLPSSDADTETILHHNGTDGTICAA